MQDWIIPYNPKVYDITNNWFGSNNTTLIRQSVKTLQLGDIVYVYNSKPDGRVLYKLEVVELDMPSVDANYDYCFRGKLVGDYRDKNITAEDIKEHGIKFPILSLRRINAEASEYLRSLSSL